MKITYMSLDATETYVCLGILRGDKAHVYYQTLQKNRPARILNLFLAFLRRMEMGA